MLPLQSVVGRSVSLMAGLVPLLASSPAAAHVIIEGVTGFASLVLHPLVAVDTILVIAALATVVGATERPMLPLLCPLPALVGGVLGVSLQLQALLWPGLWRLPLVVAIALAAYAASGRNMAPWGALAATLIAATTVGLGLVPESPDLGGRLEAGAAAAAALLLGLLVLAWPRTMTRHHIARLAGRVMSAWIAAIAALGLAVTLR